MKNDISKYFRFLRFSLGLDDRNEFLDGLDFANDVDGKSYDWKKMYAFAKKQSFGKLFGSLLTSPPTRTFIDQGYLAPYDYVVVGKYSTDQRIVDSLKARGSDGDYAVKEMDEKLNVPDGIKRLYQSVMEYAKGRKGIVFAIDILHAQVIARYYEEMGLRAVVAPKYNKLELLPRGRVRITNLIGNEEVRYLRELLN